MTVFFFSKFVIHFSSTFWHPIELKFGIPVKFRWQCNIIVTASWSDGLQDKRTLGWCFEFFVKRTCMEHDYQNCNNGCWHLLIWISGNLYEPLKRWLCCKLQLVWTSTKPLVLLEPNNGNQSIKFENWGP